MAGWFNSILDSVLPPTCVSCERPGAWWCTTCASCVVKCQQPITGYCADLTGIRAGARFRRPVSDAIKALKYRHARAVASELARYLEPELKQLAKDVGTGDTLLVPVPLHISRLKKRGHNQAEVLTQELSKQTGTPWQDALRRTRATPTQTKLHRRERFANVSGAFEWRGSAPKKTVILIDDVVTTGATFEAAAQAVRAGSSTSPASLTVWGLAVAYRDQNRP